MSNKLQKYSTRFYHPEVFYIHFMVSSFSKLSYLCTDKTKLIHTNALIPKQIKDRSSFIELTGTFQYAIYSLFKITFNLDLIVMVMNLFMDVGKTPASLNTNCYQKQYSQLNTMIWINTHMRNCCFKNLNNNLYHHLYYFWVIVIADEVLFVIMKVLMKLNNINRVSRST